MGSLARNFSFKMKLISKAHYPIKKKIIMKINYINEKKIFIIFFSF